ncbi:ATP-binding protein, partial [Brevirhabdus pacifica]
ALASRLTGLVAERDRLQQAHDALKQDAPDLEAARITLTRARSVCEGAERDIAAKRTAQAALDSTIDLRSGEGVEEDLADVAERLEAARTDLEHIRFEVAMLTRLRDALRQARADARDRTMAPVLKELRPLLRLLWPDAEIHFDDRILPTHLSRNGQQEEIDLLSGGTREQIAFLVRLAFARLLAGSGRHAPVILDDALIFTDDDRIEAMFDALHRQAGDIQILVLSCRQRAFRALGGTSLTIEPDGGGSGPA